MKKVAIIAPNSMPIPPIRGGGIQTVINATVPLYKQYKPYVLSNCEYGIDKLPLKETVGGIEHRRICLSPWHEFVVNLKHLSIRNYLPYVLSIISQIKEIKPDLIHVMNRPWFLPILRKYLGNEARIILHHHNLYFTEMKKNKVWDLLKLTDAFAGISDYTVKSEVTDRFPAEKDRCFTIYNGIDLNKFQTKWANAGTGAITRKRFDLKPDDLVLMFAGRLRKEKGIHTLIKAACHIIKDNCNVKLMIVGSHFYLADNKKTPFIENLIKLADPIKENVIFTGFIPPADMPQIYAAADILIVPSHTDAFGLTYAEAGASGIPSIGTRLEGIPEVIEDGITGLLMKDPEDVNELVSLIRSLISDRNRMKILGENARKRVEKLFSVEASAARTEEIYNKVLAFPKRSSNVHI